MGSIDALVSLPRLSSDLAHTHHTRAGDVNVREGRWSDAGIVKVASSVLAAAQDDFYPIISLPIYKLTSFSNVNDRSPILEGISEPEDARKSLFYS